MTYGSLSGVRALVSVPETSEWDSRIIDWILESDEAVTKRLGQTFSAPVPLLIVRLSNLLTAIQVIDRLKAEGSLDAFVLGDYRELGPLAAADSALKDYGREAEEIFGLYRVPVVKSSDYEHIEEEG